MPGQQGDNSECYLLESKGGESQEASPMTGGSGDGDPIMVYKESSDLGSPEVKILGEGRRVNGMVSERKRGSAERGEEEEEREDKEIDCGIMSWRPAFLQRFNTPPWLLFFFCLYGMALGEFLIHKNFLYFKACCSEENRSLDLLIKIACEISKSLAIERSFFFWQ